MLTSDICDHFLNIKHYRASSLGLIEIKSNALSNCTNLEEINLGNNLLSQIDPILFKDNRLLKYIYLYSNKLKKIDMKITDYTPFLQKLHLSDNLLDEFFLDKLIHLNHLKFLFIDKNYLQNIEMKDVFDKFPNLKYMSICNNAFSEYNVITNLNNLLTEKNILTDLKYCSIGTSFYHA